MLISYNSRIPSQLFWIWLMKYMYTMLFGLWTLMVRTHTSDLYSYLTSHCAWFEVFLRYRWQEIISKYPEVWTSQEGLPTYIPLCISRLTSLKNLCENPFLYLKKRFSAPAKRCMHIVLVIVTSVLSWSSWEFIWFVVLYLVDMSCEWGSGGGFYRAVSADNCDCIC